MKKAYLFIALALASISLQAKYFKGSEIYSTTSYLYGRFEMSIKAAPGSGQLSTFFLYRNNSETSKALWQEIDIEIFGKDSNVFQTNVIVEKTEGNKLHTEAKHSTKRSLSALYHKYVIEWTPDSINWFIDDSLLRTEKDYAKLCNAPMSLRFNHWAANITSWVGTFDKTVLPQYQYVDYISYSSYTPDSGDAGTDFTFKWKDDFNSFDSKRWAKADWTFNENLTDFIPQNAYTENGMLVLKLHDVTPPPIIDTTTRTAQRNGESIFKISPNPFRSSIRIDTDLNDDYLISISHANGESIARNIPNNDQAGETISAILASLYSGMYYITISRNNDVVTSRALIKY